MTYQAAIFAVREVGTIAADGGRIKVQLPPSAVARLSPAIEVIRLERATVIEALGSPCPRQPDIDHASEVLNRLGVRIMRIDGAAVIGVWSDLDGPEIRAALQTLEITLPIRYLDGTGIPPPYRSRRVAGEAVSGGGWTALSCDGSVT